MSRSIVCICSIVIFFVTCKKDERGYTETLYRIKHCFEEQNYDECVKYMTLRTQKLLKKLESSFPQIADAGYGMAVLFRKGSEWEIVKVAGNEKNANVKVRYVKHPTENIIGSEVEFVLKKENGEWKLDMEKEIENLIENIKF